MPVILIGLLWLLVFVNMCGIVHFVSLLVLMNVCDLVEISKPAGTYECV